MIFAKNYRKIQSFRIVKKAEIYVRKLYLSIIYSKFQVDILIFDPQMIPTCVQTYDVIIWIAICGPFRQVMENQMTPLDLWGKSSLETCVFYFILCISKFDPLWPGLALQRGQIVKWSLPSRSTSRIGHKTCAIRILKLMWPLVTWPWPWPVLNLWLILMQYLPLAFGSASPEFWLAALDSLGFAANSLEICHFDLWPDHDLTFDLFRKIVSVL